MPGPKAQRRQERKRRRKTKKTQEAADRNEPGKGKERPAETTMNRRAQKRKRMRAEAGEDDADGGHSAPPERRAIR